jgi:hypothetical protein
VGLRGPTSCRAIATETMTEQHRKSLIFFVISALLFSTPGLFTRGVSADHRPGEKSFRTFIGELNSSPLCKHGSGRCLWIDRVQHRRH